MSSNYLPHNGEQIFNPCIVLRNWKYIQLYSFWWTLRIIFSLYWWLTFYGDTRSTSRNNCIPCLVKLESWSQLWALLASFAEFCNPYENENLLSMGDRWHEFIFQFFAPEKVFSSISFVSDSKIKNSQRTLNKIIDPFSITVVINNWTNKSLHNFWTVSTFTGRGSLNHALWDPLPNPRWRSTLDHIHLHSPRFEVKYM